MSASTLTADKGEASFEPIPKTTRPRNVVRKGDLAAYLAITFFVLLAWALSRLELFTAGSDVGYWIGVAGGVSMLFLFTYPMRKYFRFMQNWGKGYFWFVVHMVLGVAGPVLILLHSTFRIGSLNAGVALISMLVVAASGVVGRFIYVHIYRGLHGEQTSLNELQRALGLQEEAVHSRLKFAPRVEAWLKEFEADAFGAGRHPLRSMLQRLLVLSWRRWHVNRRCRRELKLRLMAAAIERKWSRRELQSHLRRSRRVVDDYLLTLTRTAQYEVYVRLFSFWHVAHVPFVYIMVITAVVHVIAVHAY